MSATDEKSFEGRGHDPAMQAWKKKVTHAIKRLAVSCSVEKNIPSNSRYLCIPV